MATPREVATHRLGTDGIPHRALGANTSDLELGGSLVWVDRCSCMCSLSMEHEIDATELSYLPTSASRVDIIEV